MARPHDAAGLGGALQKWPTNGPPRDPAAEARVACDRAIALAHTAAEAAQIRTYLDRLKAGDTQPVSKPGGTSRELSR